MTKYNLLMEDETDNYTLEEDIEFTSELLDEEEFKKIYNQLYEKVMNYLEESNSSKIILISDINGMQNQEDFDEFCKKYCPFDDIHVSHKPFTDEWYSAFQGVNDFSDKFVWMSTEGAYFVVFTEDFLNKYIDKKEDENNG